MSVSDEHGGFTKDNPFFAPLSINVNLSGQGSGKETRHFEISLEGIDAEYDPGDSLGVIPENCENVVAELLNAAGFTGNETVNVSEEEQKSLREALVSDYACTGITKILLKKYNVFAQSTELERLLAIENKEQLQEYLWGRELVDLLEDFPAPELSANDLVGFLRSMPPRLYSIASSLKAHPNEVHLTVAVVTYESHGRSRKGVCSTYLAERVDGTIPCYFHPNKNFKLPEDPDVPIIMVGPGTGIAPFRAFVEERVATGAKGRNWLFFGDRSAKDDYLYGDEWTKYKADGILADLDLAWSRDQRDKVYVQHKMLEKSKQLWDWLQDGALFYVCGDANRMAKDVDQALKVITAKEGGMDEESAAAYVKAMQKEKRYLRDVY